MNALLARKIKFLTRRRDVFRAVVYIPHVHAQKTTRKERRDFALPLLRRHEFRVGGECVHAMSTGVLRRRKQAASVD